MRLIATFTETDQAESFGHFLQSEGIESSVDAVPQPELHGQVHYQVWVLDEDRVEDAEEWYRRFLAEPQDPLFHRGAAKGRAQAEPQSEEEAPPPRRSALLWPGARRIGRITLLLILASVALFFWGNVRAFTLANDSTEETFLVVSAPYAALMYDYPAPLQALTELTEKYTEEQLKEPSTLPPEGRALLRKARTTPFWQGIYGEFLARWHNPSAKWVYEGAIFEQIGEGEVWRLWTPCILHGGFLHIFFNVLWMLILSSQVETRLGWWRFSLFILVAGILSNTAQYLMSGPLFFGLSGIVCALLGFIWTRQRIAPWEGYQLNRPTIIFILIFLLGMGAIQLFAFISELSGGRTFETGIANTAHIAGLLVGIIAARIPIFQIQERA
jgi:GlpG protein